MDNNIKHKKMMEMYKGNPEVINFLCDFFKVRKGIRTIAFQDKTIPIHNLYAYNKQKSLRTINKRNCLLQLHNNKAVGFFREYIFNKTVLKNNINHWIYDEKSYRKDDKRILHNDNIIGSSIMLELDAPKIGDNKVDMFEKSVYEDFMTLKIHIEKELYKREMKYNCASSGNGIYIILETIYMDEENLNLSELRHINKKIMKEFNLFDENNKPKIDNFDHGWSNYFKIPFTYHEFKNRMTIPLSKGYIDKTWFKKATNMNSKYCYSEENINDILETCRWNKIW